MVDKSKLKGLCIYLPIPFYSYLKERAEKNNVSMSKYLTWLVSCDINNYIHLEDNNKTLEEFKNERFS